MRFGGSFASWSSLTCVATTVPVQLSPPAKSLSGFSVTVLPPLPETAEGMGAAGGADDGERAGRDIHGSLKVTLRSAPTATLVARLAGVVLITEGAASTVKHQV